MEIANYKISDISEGMSCAFTKTVTTADIDGFAKITGDISPLHISDSFAVSKGYQGRVVHGALLAGFISRLIGVHFPGENCLLQSLNVKFHAPCFVNDIVEIKAKVDQVSHGANAMVLEVTVDNAKTRLTLAKAKVHVSFLNDQK